MMFQTGFTAKLRNLVSLRDALSTARGALGAAKMNLPRL
jgi:hypothetical protein